ncbi:unnamed protein product [Musa acuminata subsp. malaccensis]|uniref:(wild Malaysian banana) hypothetical protein n=1 Tax=Musa acuminata subsp. malaccensis TaxID=214687 RepID=A0A804I0L4_MUSAM|nr:unnamed protein product [Musa acuminata subsp. malaccensis]
MFLAKRQDEIGVREGLRLGPFFQKKMLSPCKYFTVSHILIIFTIKPIKNLEVTELPQY